MRKKKLYQTHFLEKDIFAKTKSKFEGYDTYLVSSKRIEEIMIIN